MNVLITISLIANFLLMALLVMVLLSVLRKNEKKGQRHDSGGQTVADAQKRAQEIIDSATEHARDALLKTVYIKDSIVNDLEKDLTDVSNATVSLLRNEAVGFHKEYSVLLETIQVEHARMLDEARTALKAVEEAKTTLIQELEAEMKQVVNNSKQSVSINPAQIEKLYTDMLISVRKEFESKAVKSLQALEKIPEQEIIEFRAVLKTETLSAQKLLSDRVSELFAAAEKEVAAYKTARLKEVEVSLQGVTSRVLREILGQKLGVREQEQLLMKALEKVKKEGVLTQKTVEKRDK